MMFVYSAPAWLPTLNSVFNHLWQSTLFAAIVALLTLALRKNQARWRCWLWLAASIKFLIPFSVLVGIGNRFGWQTPGLAAQPRMAFFMEEIRAAFVQPMVHEALIAAPSVAFSVVPALVHQPRSQPPHQRMEPEDSFHHHVHSRGEVVAAAYVANLVRHDGF